MVETLLGLGSKWCENWAQLLRFRFLESRVCVVGCSFKYLRKWNRTCFYSSSSSCHHNRNLAQFLFFFPRPLGELPRLVLLGFMAWNLHGTQHTHTQSKYCDYFFPALLTKILQEWFTCKTMLALAANLLLQPSVVVVDFSRFPDRLP